MLMNLLPVVMITANRPECGTILPELPTFRDRDSSGPRRFGTRGDVSGARYRQFGSCMGTDSSGVGYRQFGSWIKMKYYDYLNIKE